MSVCLLDVNVLVARFWETHAFYPTACAWFLSHEREGWATCAITQAGMARTLSNPGFYPDGPSPAEAIHWFAESVRHDPSHHFWPDDLPLSALSASIKQRMTGHKQITDAYLLALAMHHGGKLVTFDYRIEALAPEGSAEREALVILRA